MIVEIVVLFTVLLVGAAFLHAVGLTSFELSTIYPLVGMPIYVVIAYLQAIAGIYTSPRITIAICLGIVFIYALYKSKEILNSRYMLQILCMSLVIIALVAVSRNVNLVKLHIDSMGYLLGGSLIESGNVALIGTYGAVNRFTSITILHAAANGAGELYLRALGLVVGLSALGALFWFIKTGLEQSLSQTQATLFAVAGGMLLLTNNRFIWHIFYINGHLITAAFMLVAAGSGWLAALKPSFYKQLLCLQAVAAVGLVLSRPEGALMAAIALLPTLLSVRIPWRWRAGTLAVFGLAVLLQQGFIVTRTWPRIPDSALEFVGLGVLAIASVPLLSLRSLDGYAKYGLAAVEVSLWVALAIFAIYAPEVLQRSATATFANVFLGRAGWGASLAVLTTLVAIVLVFSSAPDRIFLRFPLTTFLPLAFLLAYLRHEPYRVGVTDSLSRMLIHIVPLAILFVASAAASRGWAPLFGGGEPRQVRLPTT